MNHFTSPTYKACCFEREKEVFDHVHSRNLLLFLTALAIALLFVPNRSWGQASSSKERVYTMFISAQIQLNGSMLRDSADKVIAMVDGKFGGISSPVFLRSSQEYIVYLEVKSNHPSGDIHFQLLDQSLGKLIPLSQSVQFRPNGMEGSFRRPLQLAGRFTPNPTNHLSEDQPITYDTTANQPVQIIMPWRAEHFTLLSDKGKEVPCAIYEVDDQTYEVELEQHVEGGTYFLHAAKEGQSRIYPILKTR